MQQKAQPDAPSYASDAPDINMLIDQHHESIYRYSFRLTGRKAEAEDVTQQTFLLAMEKLSQLRKPSSARSWLMTIARNCFLKRLRNNSKSHAASDLNVDVEQFTQEVEPASICDDFDEGALQRTLLELDPHHRVVIMMFYFEEMSYREIADQLDLKIGTVMSRLSRAKARLKDAMVRQTNAMPKGVDHG